VKHLYLFGLILLLPFYGLSQDEWNNWYFGEHAGITFNSGAPVALTNCSPLFMTQMSDVTVSDSLGNLLFYAENEFSSSVFNRNHGIMPNGNLTNTFFHLTRQPFFSVQKLTDDSIYYLFSIIDSASNFSIGLAYSIIDMRLDGGLGDIVPGQKSLPVPGGGHASMVVTGTRHHNNKDVWIVVRNRNDSFRYLSYLVSSSGINTIPEISQSLCFADSSNGESINSIKISPDGTKLISLYDTAAEYCSFNSNTGIITPLFKIQFTPKQNFEYCNAEFSIDNKYVYVTVYDMTTIPNNYTKLLQYDASKTDSVGFKNSEVLISSRPIISVIDKYTGLQRGPDHKIYCPAWNKDSLNVINNPSMYGLACNFQRDALCLLPGNITNEGLPQFLEKYYVYIHHSAILCATDSIHFTSSIWPVADSIHWDFGDPASGPNNYSNLPNPSHLFTSSGSHTVELFVRHIDKRTDTAYVTITIPPGVMVNLGVDRVTCEGDSVLLDAGACNGCSYVWDNLTTNQMNIANTQTYWAKISGDYRVTVSNPAFCPGMDTVNVYVNLKSVITNNPLSKNICSGDFTNIVLTATQPATTFTWTAIPLTGGVTGWTASGTGPVINQQLINWFTTPGIIDYLIVPLHRSCFGPPSDFIVTVDHSDSVKVSISASGNNVCAGTTVTFTANPTNQGATPVYQWFANGFGGGSGPATTMSYTPANNDVVNCVLTSSVTTCLINNPATSNSIPMTVNPNLPVSVIIVPDLNVVCQGQTITFTATPVNGGTTPTYSWKVNGITIAGAALPTYSYIPVNGDLVNCILTSSEICTSSNPASSIQHQVSVSPNLLVSITINPDVNPVCLGSTVTFTASPVNGGTTPAYQWFVNSIPVPGNNNPVYAYIPINGDLVSCTVTSSELCTTNNPASSIQHPVSVSPGLPVSVTIAASSNPFCPGSSVTYTATPVNGGSTPSYQWKVNGINTGTNSTYTYNPVNSDSVRCVMISNLGCVTGSPASSAKIIMSGTLAPIVTFTSCFDTITRVNAKPIKLKGGIPLGGTYSGPGVNSITSVFTPALAGVGTHTITYSYTNAALCTASKSISILNLPSSILFCGNALTDPRDNQVYQTVQIGAQCWFAEDLNYGTEIPNNQDQRDNCIAEKYKNPFSILNPPSSVYQWDELMTYDETPADQGFCPPGWHIPSENDWNILFSNYINSSFAGSPLKYSGYSGFNALLSGVRDIKKGWDLQGFATFFWSSTPSGSTKAWAHGMNEVDPSVSSYPALRVNAFPVRCLKD